MRSSNTRELVLAYHHSFHQGDRAAVRKLLKDDGAFIGPLNSFNNADTFLDGAAIFMQLTKKVETKELIVEGDNACLYYDYTTIVPSVPVIPIASVFRIEAGKIKLFHTHFNPIPFVKAKENGDVAKALGSLK